MRTCAQGPRRLFPVLPASEQSDLAGCVHQGAVDCKIWLDWDCDLIWICPVQVMVIVMLCAIFALSLPQLASQNARLRSVILLLAVANGFFGILLHFSNTLQPEKSMFNHVHRLLGA